MDVHRALGCWRDVGVTRRRTALQQAGQIRALVDAPRYADTERITLVYDNLNTHDMSYLYTAFEPSEAKHPGSSGVGANAKAR